MNSTNSIDNNDQIPFPSGKVKRWFQVYNASAGSGKTFTLVKEYLKILLNTSDVYKFQHILAVTFTNKAAAEMKVRIIDSLRNFSDKEIKIENNQLFLMICNELDLEPDTIHKRAQKILKSILNNYGAFNITTIDSFTYKLIKSFAFDLGLSMNFEVEMDAVSLLNEAVDVLISKIGKDKELTKTLIDFSIQKANEDKSWDITFDLKEIAKLLLNENDASHIEKLQKKPIQDFIDLKNKLYKQQQEIEKKFNEIGIESLQLIDNLQVDYKDFYRSQLPTYFKNLAYSIDKIKFSKESSLAKNIESENFYSKSKPQVIKDAIDSIIPELIEQYKKSEILFQDYLLHKLISKSLIPLAILQSINNELTQIKKYNNIRLNSEFNQLISKHLKEQPVAFIYEKIGEKYHHYFIDEMQDTSVLQWENLIPLIDNVLSSETGSLLLVGDAKQAIYRWRGGKAEQFIGLTNDVNPFQVSKKINQLETNFRSFSEIINFNNSFFKHLSKYLKNEQYADLYVNGNQQKLNDKKGGFVQLSFIEEGLNAVEKDEVYPEKVFEIIKELDNEFNKSDICILTRTRKQGIVIAQFLSERNIEIISSETLLLQNSPKVQFIINLLEVINQPNDKECKLEILHFLHNHLNIKESNHLFFNDYINLENKLFFENLEKQGIYFNLEKFAGLPLYESIEEIIRNFKLVNTSDAYIQFFLDVVLDFSTKKQEGVLAFLNYWGDKKDKLSIVVPQGKNAIQIMTIHKAKGLEFPVVIYPYDLDIYRQINPKVWYEPLDKEVYNGFESALINYNNSLKEIGEIGKKLYNSQRLALELDNFNLLYVALTRAEEQLYIISEHKKPFSEPKLYSQFFIDYLQTIGKWNENQSVYEFGNKNRPQILDSKKKKSTIKSIAQKQFITSPWNEHNITIVSNSIFNTEDNFEDARKYGNLIHEILATVYTEKDVKNSVLNFVNNGIIPSNKEQEIILLIEKITDHKDLNSYFTDNYTIINEREIITTDKLALIPDRLNFKDNTVTIIDYKTGKEEKKHEYQINNYANVLTEMGYEVVSKLLVYIDDEVTVVRV